MTKLSAMPRPKTKPIGVLSSQKRQLVDGEHVHVAFRKRVADISHNRTTIGGGVQAHEADFHLGARVAHRVRSPQQLDEALVAHDERAIRAEIAAQIDLADDPNALASEVGFDARVHGTENRFRAIVDIGLAAAIEDGTAQLLQLIDVRFGRAGRGIQLWEFQQVGMGIDANHPDRAVRGPLVRRLGRVPHE
jgi:hypothetical protein